MNTSCFRISRDDISLAEDIKLLGVTLDKDLNFDKQKADIARNWLATRCGSCKGIRN